MHLSSSTWQQPTPPRGASQRQALLTDLAAEIVRRGAGRLSVAVDGRTGAGKTSFGHELGLALEALGRSVYRASLDDYKRPWAERHEYDRESGQGYYRNAFDLERIRRCLLDPVRGDGVVALCGIDPLTQIDHGDEMAEMVPDGILVVDGVFAARPELIDAWDVLVWLDISPEVALRRGLERDGADEATERLHRDRYGVAEAVYLAEVDVVGRADSVIDNTDLDAPVRRR